MESVFGFVTVLPGAFCAYRMAAVQGKPLDEYFKAISGEYLSNQQLRSSAKFMFRYFRRSHTDARQHVFSGGPFDVFRVACQEERIVDITLRE